ncbi:MAG TPA: NAD(+) diphosphatase [Acidimicrobiales bacterium]|nr:NAD(+) diphosphatase [Acidimicrobiales bacterium]
MEPWEALVVPPPGLAPGDALWWCVQGNRVLVADDGALPTVPPVDTTEPLFLGLLGGRPCWAVDTGPEVEAPDGYAYRDLFSAHAALGERRWAIAGRAVQLVDWARCHRYCGRCGTETEPSLGERARRCPSCGLLAFPRLAPAVITLVDRGDEALLARNVNFGASMYSCIAGFVEPGETLEEAVAREVREEVGVEVRDMRYQSSQPWPFPHSLMIGFRATWASGEIKLDPTEIADAQWFRFDALPQVPPGISIARSLIDGWVRDRQPH